ncbi:MAG: nucleotide exchange factor GrpE, partial [Candidatus Paceibacterota bacterium]
MTKNKENNKKEESIDLEKKLEELEKEKNEYLNGWKRAKADLINYKNGENERFNSFLRSKQRDLILDILRVLDSFEIGIIMTKGEAMDKKGVEMIRNQFQETLKSNGVVKIEVKIGDDFNPEVHEAVEYIDSDTPEDSIVEVIENGYKFKDVVLRPVKVKISKAK